MTERIERVDMRGRPRIEAEIQNNHERYARCQKELEYDRNSPFRPTNVTESIEHAESITAILAEMEKLGSNTQMLNECLKPDFPALPVTERQVGMMRIKANSSQSPEERAKKFEE